MITNKFNHVVLLGSQGTDNTITVIPNSGQTYSQLYPKKELTYIDYFIGINTVTFSPIRFTISVYDGTGYEFVFVLGTTINLNGSYYNVKLINEIINNPKYIDKNGFIEILVVVINAYYTLNTTTTIEIQTNKKL